MLRAGLYCYNCISAHRGGRANFIVIEDDLSIRYLLTKILKELGHQVLAVVDNVDSAMRHIKAGKVPDFVLLDIILPGAAGPTIVDYLKENYKEIKVIIVTGLGEEQVMHHFPDGNFDAVLRKPFTAEQLATLIKSFIPGPSGKP